MYFFQKEKKELSEQRARDDALRSRGGITIPLSKEHPEDRHVAGVLMRRAQVKSEFSASAIHMAAFFSSTNGPIMQLSHLSSVILLKF